MGAGEGKKKRNFGPSHPSGPHPSGPDISGFGPAHKDTHQIQKWIREKMDWPKMDLWGGGRRRRCPHPVVGGVVQVFHELLGELLLLLVAEVEEGEVESGVDQREERTLTWMVM